MNRRTFLTGMGTLLAAPAIVRASTLMPVRGDMPMPASMFPAQTATMAPMWSGANGDTLTAHFEVPFRGFVEIHQQRGWPASYGKAVAFDQARVYFDHDGIGWVPRRPDSVPLHTRRKIW